MFEHLDKLQALEDRYIDLEAKISDPSVISDQAQWQKYTKAHAKLTDVVETYRAYQKLQKTYDDDQALLEMGECDEELAAMAEMEMKELAPQLEDYEKLVLKISQKNQIGSGGSSRQANASMNYIEKNYMKEISLEIL